jgi:hypothetical protein
MKKTKGGSTEAKEGASPSQLIDARRLLGSELSSERPTRGGRGGQVEKPSNSMRGLRCGRTPASSAPVRRTRHVVKLTFAKGASLEDPSGLFNASLKATRGAIDFHEGDTIDEEAFKAAVRAAVALNTSSAAQRPGTRQRSTR